MNYAILILQYPFRQQELATHYGQPLPLVEIGRHDDVRNTSFIFHRDKDETLCRAGMSAGAKLGHSAPRERRSAAE